MANDRVYAYDLNSGDYVYRIPGHHHGDGQVDSDESPVWILTDQETAEAACDGDVPDVKL
jgi:hypothetical protein